MFLCELDLVENARMLALENEEKRHIAGLFKTHQFPP
jgi:hypothetical protein